jgi:hypothetical protein
MENDLLEGGYGKSRPDRVSMGDLHSAVGKEKERREESAGKFQGACFALTGV